ncbi:MAG: acyl carrier protein [Verrucomicrobiota bacterium]|mgnify:CR=1 FL=1|jgi:acyl carrier protein
MTNREKLSDLLLDIFLLEPEEFSFDLTREDVETWDSLAVVSVAVGVKETFGYHFTPEEATGVARVQDIIDLLENKGISFAD